MFAPGSTFGVSFRGKVEGPLNVATPRSFSAAQLCSVSRKARKLLVRLTTLVTLLGLWRRCSNCCLVGWTHNCADAKLTHFEYFVLAMLSDAPEHTLRMTSLAAQTNATLPRLSHVVRRLEGRGLVERSTCTQNARATDVRLTRIGWVRRRATAPGHVATVR